MFVSCSTRQRVGWRDYAERMRTWLCPGLPRLCNTRAVCTVIMNQSKKPSSCGQLKGRSAMPDEVSRPHFVFFVAAGAAHLDVTVTCFTCLVFLLFSPYRETLSRELRGRVSVWLECTEGRADARNEDTRLIVEAACNA